MRLLIFFCICIILYYLIKSYLKKLFQPKDHDYHHRPGPGPWRSDTRKSPPAPVTDQLVKDEVCGVYCPKKEALPLIWQGKVYYFCSEKCREQFKKEKGLR